MVKGRDTHKQKVKGQRKNGLHIFIYLKITLKSIVTPKVLFLAYRDSALISL